ncbi:transmembrane protein 107-like [Xenia sp. Carnegie-2017]|uniref:transmembrane protein 107-like n=1 Tax=Xenia sp. Carnegie-2017 TaxID=2897299 RepID=UPI001F037421|nr:transmembrane protein 107-like [Xenia sp. Carnegie-2017]
MSVGSLIPARFLTLTAHLVITIVIFWSKESNVSECLPVSYSPSEYDNKSKSLVVGLSIMLACIFIELMSFLGGISMFHASASMLSIAVHGVGTIVLSFFILESWNCDRFWFIFGFSSVLPVLVEVFVLVTVLGLKKGI